MNTEKLKVGGGDIFSEAAMTAHLIAKSKSVIVEFVFNEVVCLVDANTNLDWLYRDYSRSWTMGWKTVGPDCVENYSPELQSEFEAKTKIREDEQARQESEWREKDRNERRLVGEKTSGVVMEFSDKEGWDKSRAVNSDGYGGAAMDYAETWAKLMQIEIDKGKSIAECYDYTQNGLGYLGITGFQFGCAVSILSQTWKYGEELRKVHNKKYGVSEEKKGTVNPAVLHVGQ